MGRSFDDDVMNNPPQYWLDNEAKRKTEEKDRGEKPMSVVKNWVCELGLRHQGVLISAVRGCDTVGREHPSKALVRALRAAVLNSFCGDPKKAASFIEIFDDDDFEAIADNVAHDFDSLPTHYVLHLMHAAEIIGYHHPEQDESRRWAAFYRLMCRKMHLTPETKSELDSRLSASEERFKECQ